MREVVVKTLTTKAGTRARDRGEPSGTGLEVRTNEGGDSGARQKAGKFVGVKICPHTAAG
jgi:hypothetical protein